MKWKTVLINSGIWTLDPQLLALDEKVVKPLGAVLLLEEVRHCGWAWKVQSGITTTVLYLFSDGSSSFSILQPCPPLVGISSSGTISSNNLSYRWFWPWYSTTVMQSNYIKLVPRTGYVYDELEQFFLSKRGFQCCKQSIIDLSNRNL